MCPTQSRSPTPISDRQHPGPGPAATRRLPPGVTVAVVSDDVFPDRDMSQRDKIEFMLERDGWAIEAVRARSDLDPPIPTYSYTIGVQDRFRFPELLIFGLKPVACRGLFQLVVDALAGGTEFPIGQPFIGLLDGSQPAAFLPIEAATAVGMLASLAEHRRVNGAADTDFSIVQLAWPDRAGVLPWEDRFDPQMAMVQLLLGEPPA